MFNKLDLTGFEEAITDPRGPISGTIGAYDRQQSRMVIDGRIPITSAYDSVAVDFARAERGYKKLSKAGYQELEAEFDAIWRMEAEAIERWPERPEQVKAWANALRSETLEEYSSNMAPVQRTLNARATGSAEVIEETTGLTAAEIETTVTEMAVLDDTIEIASVQALSLAEAETEAAHILQVRDVVKRTLDPSEKAGRGPYVREDARVAARKGRPDYPAVTMKHPAQLKGILEKQQLTADQLYDTIDDYSQRMFEKYLAPMGKEYGKIPARELRTFAAGTGERGYVVERMEALTGEEMLKIPGDDLNLMMQKMTIDEYKTMETLLEAHEKALIAEGRQVAGETLIPKRSQAQIERLGGGVEEPGFYRPGTGWYEDFPTGTSKLAEKEIAKQRGAAEWIKPKVRALTMEEAQAAGEDLERRVASGETRSELALEEVIDLIDSVKMSEAIGQFDKTLLIEGFAYDSVNEVLHSVPHSLSAAESQLKKMISLASFFATLGVMPGMFGLLGGPSEAHAGAEVGAVRAFFRTARAVGRTATKEAGALRETLAAGAKELGLIPPEVDSTTVKILAGNYQRGLPDVPGIGGSTEFLKRINTITKNFKEGIRHAFMSPGMLFDEVIRAEEGFMSSPAVFRVSYQNAEYFNIGKADEVLANIMRINKIKGEPAEIGKMFEPLVPKHLRHIEAEFHKSRMAEILEEIETIKKPKLDKAGRIDLAIAEEQYNTHKRTLTEFSGAREEFHREWLTIAESAAKDSPSFRVFMSVYDGPDFVRAPFMKNVRLAPNEATAAGQWREWLLEYRTRLENEGVQVIKGSYAPTIMHPSSRAQFMERQKGHPSAAAYMRFYARSPDSRPLMGDFPTSMMRYIRDTERRIQNKAYWNSNWGEVERKTQHIPVMARAFKALREGVVPIEQTPGNVAANWYVQFEAWKRLHLNPSAGGKHLMKMTGSMATAGIGQTLKAIPEGAKFTLDRILDLRPSKMKQLTDLGYRSMRAKRKAVRDFQRSMIPPRNHRQRLIDMGVFADHEMLSTWRSMWHRVQNVGSMWINFAELFDRGVTSMAGLEMAAKRGMTAEQAYYGSLELMLKNNFFSRELNPKWMNNPKWRALLMFQGTPFKIFERRLVTAVRSGRVGKKLWNMTKGAVKDKDSARQLLSDIRGLRSAMKTTEQEVKVNLIADALKSEVDFFGTPVTNQLAKDILITGALLGGGGTIGMNLKHHVFHLPFFSGMTHDPVVSFSPGILAALRGHRAWQQQEANDSEFLFTKIMKKWLGPVGPLPDVVWKGMRITKNDIPEMYRDSKFRYLFAIPYQGED
jgi:hypothetical protein